MNLWFRFYSETLRDRKLERCARVTETPRCLIIGVWATLLTLCNDSPVDGGLFITKDRPLSMEDLENETGLDTEQLQEILNSFSEMQMLELFDGAFYITNWKKRQFKSDSSTERVRNYRERKQRNVTETLHQSFGNESVTPPDTDTDTDTDTEADIVESKSDSTPKPPKYPITELLEYWRGSFPAKPQPRNGGTEKLQRQFATRCKDPYFRENWRAALERVKDSEFCLTGGWFDLGWFLKNDDNWQKCLSGNYDNKKKNGNGHNGGSKNASNSGRIEEYYPDITPEQQAAELADFIARTGGGR